MLLRKERKHTLNLKHPSSERRPLNRNINRLLSCAWPMLIVQLLFPHMSLGTKEGENWRGTERARDRVIILKLNKNVLKQFETLVMVPLRELLCCP